MSENPGPLPQSVYRRFESVAEYEALTDTLLLRTERIVRVFDRRLSRHWNSAQRCALLREFLLANPLNRLMIVVHDADRIGKECPRLLQLLQQFGHAAKMRQTTQAAKNVYDPFVIFDAAHYLHRFHYNHMRAAQGSFDLEATQELLDRYGEIWDASMPAAGAHLAGL